MVSLNAGELQRNFLQEEFLFFLRTKRSRVERKLLKGIEFSVKEEAAPRVRDPLVPHSLCIWRKLKNEIPFCERAPIDLYAPWSLKLIECLARVTNSNSLRAVLRRENPPWPVYQLRVSRYYFNFNPTDVIITEQRTSIKEIALCRREKNFPRLTVLRANFLKNSNRDFTSNDDDRSPLTFQFDSKRRKKQLVRNVRFRIDDFKRTNAKSNSFAELCSILCRTSRTMQHCGVAASVTERITINATFRPSISVTRPSFNEIERSRSAPRVNLPPLLIRWIYLFFTSFPLPYFSALPPNGKRSYNIGEQPPSFLSNDVCNYPRWYSSSNIVEVGVRKMSRFWTSDGRWRLLTS